MAVAYLACESEKLLEVVRELFQTYWDNRLMLLLSLLLTTLSILYVALYRPESPLHPPAHPTVDLRAHMFSVVEYALKHVAGQVRGKPHKLLKGVPP